MDLIFNEIKRERDRQKAIGWTDESDDKCTEADWVQFITAYATRNFNGPEFRSHLVKVAALAVAAIESIDRKSSRED